MEHENSIVYVKINSDGYITDVNSSAFLPETAGWTEIDRGTGDKYHHAQGNYFPLPIVTDGGACRYKLADGNAMECTQEEIAAQEAKVTIPETPTWSDIMEAQIMYTALMTDTMLEE